MPALERRALNPLIQRNMAAKKLGNSIFRTEREAGVDSALGDWRSKLPESNDSNAFKRRNSENLKMVKLDGPYDDQRNKLKAIGRSKNYVYYAVFNRKVSQADVELLDLTCSFTENKKKIENSVGFTGKAIRNFIKLSLSLHDGDEKTELSASFNGKDAKVSLEIFYKKFIVLFIGGAADKEEYYFQKPTTIIYRQCYQPFDRITNGIDDLRLFYLGYNQVASSRFTEEVLPLLKNKDSIEVAIVGNSLGGWNGTHLAIKLTELSYEVPLLITLDPVGTKPDVHVISNLYIGYPSNVESYWINLQTDPKDWEGDDYIANAGGQFKPKKSETEIYEVVPYHHGEAGKMFRHDLKNENITPSDFLLYFVNKYLLK